MLSPQAIIDNILEDSPCVYNILNEIHCPFVHGGYPDNYDGWERLYTQLPHHRPSPQELLDILKDYSGDNYDAHYWAGRYAQMRLSEEEDSIDLSFSQGVVTGLCAGSLIK